MIRPTTIAVLETMYGSVRPQRAPRFFIINPSNFSGARLYEIVGNQTRLLVTNACPQMVCNASQHGIPDSDWLYSNLEHLHTLTGFKTLLVCGTVAQETIRKNDTAFKRWLREKRVIFVPHPAARQWSKSFVTQTHNIVNSGDWRSCCIRIRETVLDVTDLK